MEKDFKFCSSNLNGPDEMKSSIKDCGIKSKFSYKNNAILRDHHNVIFKGNIHCKKVTQKLIFLC